MSEKKRQKKDGERKDKKKQVMHDAVSERKQQSGSSQAASDVSNPTDMEAGANDDRQRSRGSKR